MHSKLELHFAKFDDLNRIRCPHGIVRRATAVVASSIAAGPEGARERVADDVCSLLLRSMNETDSDTLEHYAVLHNEFLLFAEHTPRAVSLAEDAASRSFHVASESILEAVYIARRSARAQLLNKRLELLVRECRALFAESAEEYVSLCIEAALENVAEAVLGGDADRKCMDAILTAVQTRITKPDTRPNYMTILQFLASGGYALWRMGKESIISANVRDSRV
jgi:hypothetical protein